jgi:DNA-binding CsgD family transcriptional regulator
VGRQEEVERLFTLFGSDTPPLQIISGESGVGKSRLAMVVAAEAERRGWKVLKGRAYPVEQGAPYALVADAFLPLLQEIDPDRLTVLCRGREQDLLHIFPALGNGRPGRFEGMDPEEVRARVFWTFRGLLNGLSAREPLFVVLEDLHWADPSSLALMHFFARQLDTDSVRIVGTWTNGAGAAAVRITEFTRSLRTQGVLDQLEVRPLELARTTELIETVFGMSGQPVAEFARRIFGWTRGNAYFLEQTLKALIHSGALYLEDGTWLGWESRELVLPSTVRDAILVRMADLSELGEDVAEVLAVLGRPSSPSLIQRVLAGASREVDRVAVGRAVDELVQRGLVEEFTQDSVILLRFSHPLSRETLYRRLSLTRRAVLHDEIAAALEAHYSDAVESRADEIAYHLLQGSRGSGDPRATRYLTLAGRQALDRHADDEAVNYLTAALEVAAQREEPGSDAASTRRLLAHAWARTGEWGKAEELLVGLRSEAEAAGEPRAVAGLLRQLGLLAYWRGDHDEALLRLEEGLEVLPAGEPVLELQMLLTAGMAFQQLGRPAESRERILSALAVARELEDEALLARVHRALALVCTWIGETGEARDHAHRALELGQRSGDRHVVFWGHWALASLEGLVGGPAPMRPWLDRARASAQEVGSPVLRLFADELELEYLYHSGDWDGALALGARAIQLGRSLSQRALLARILVWTASVYLGRGDMERADDLIREAESLAGVSGQPEPGGHDVHASVPALIGRTQFYLAQDMGEEALEAGAGALAIAEASGYVIWVLHRLLPMMAEAFVRVRDLEGASGVRDRLLREGQRMDHQLSQLWAQGTDALITWWGGELEEAAARLGEAADAMEEMGILYDSARLRRQYAGRLAEMDRREDALAELRRGHVIFGQLGAEPELRRARAMFSELDARRPQASRTTPGDALSAREFEIATLIAERASNKQIASALDIAVRTVTTHLTNIYRRLEMAGSSASKRAALGDMVREGRITGPEGAGDGG